MVFSIAAVPICIVTRGARVPFSPHACQNLLVIFLIVGILTSVKWSHCGFDLHFPDDEGH